MINEIGKEVGMTKEEIELFKEILGLINDKEKGMYESVQKDLDRLISIGVKNDPEWNWIQKLSLFFKWEY